MNPAAADSAVRIANVFAVEDTGAIAGHVPAGEWRLKRDLVWHDGRRDASRAAIETLSVKPCLCVHRSPLLTVCGIRWQSQLFFCRQCPTFHAVVNVEDVPQ